MSVDDLLPGAAIQPDGFLVLLGADWQVLAASENIADYFPVSADALIGRPMADLFAERAVHALRNRLALRRDPQAVARSFACSLAGGDQLPFDVAMHGGEQWVIVEAQPSPSDQRGDSVETVRAMIAGLARHSELGPLLSDAVRQLRALTGYDRVLICRWRGGIDHELLAESVRTSSPRVPLCDLIEGQPSSARVIRDCEADPVPVLGSGLPELDRASLRAASRAERERLGAVGARALLALPIECAGRPWGLIACQHPQPRRPGFERLAGIDLFVQMLGLLIEICELRSRSAA